MTRTQFLVASLLLGLLILFQAIGLRRLGEFSRMMKEPAPPMTPLHGIETSWKSGADGERLWTINGPGTDFHPWLEAHIAAVAEAKRLLPLERK